MPELLVTNRKLMTTIPFDEYLKLPGHSHSSLKLNGKPAPVPTARMQLGTRVHNYLLEPEKYEHESREVKRIAIALKETIGGLFNFLLPEVAVGATFYYEGFVMQYKGRIDLCIPKRITIDLKVINGTTIYKTLDYFGYPNQVNGYSLAAETKTNLIVAYSTKTDTVEVVPIKKDDTWWKQKVVEIGDCNYD